ncbi:MAG: malate dehydrogenase [Campylobacterota bacterium]|nr:malate dehydrogenase [Campylobacterota bacterium]
MLEINLQYEQRNQLFKIISYNPTSMMVEVGIYEKETFIKTQKIPFAQVPKKIKKILNP